MTPYIYKQAPTPPTLATKSATSKTTNPVEAATPPAPLLCLLRQLPPPRECRGRSTAKRKETVIVDTDLAHIVFSSKGAVVQSWILKDFKGNNGKSLELVNPAAMNKVPAFLH